MNRHRSHLRARLSRSLVARHRAAAGLEALEDRMLLSAVSVNDVKVWEGTPGSPTSGVIPSATESEVYQFDGHEGQRVFFDSLASAPSVTWSLLAPNTNTTLYSVSEANDFAYTLPQDGSYRLTLSGPANSAFSFRLSTATTTTTPLTLGATVSSKIGLPGEQDSYTFTGSVGQRIYLDTLVSDPNLDYTLVSPTGATVWDGLLTTNSNFGPLTLVEAGTYTLRVSGNGSTTSAYSFRMLDAASAAAIAPGSTTYGGTLNPGTGTVLYTFSATAGATYLFDALGTTGAPSNWSLYGPNDSIITTSPLDGDINLFLPWTGTYLLAVEGAATSAVPYRFKVSEQTPATVSPTGFGTSHTGTLDASNGHSASFAYTMSAGQVFDFTNFYPNHAGGNVRYVLSDAVGAVIYEDYATANDVGPVVAPRSGTYTMTVTGYDDTNPYGFRLTALPTGATSLTAGATASGTFAGAYQTNFYKFTGSVGQRIMIDGLTGGGATLQVVSPTGLILYDLNGAANADSGIVTLHESGTYDILVQGAGGSYSFRYLDISSQTLITPGTRYSGAVAGATSAQLFRISATAGQRIYVDSAQTSESNLAWRLYGPNGEDLTSQVNNFDLEALAPSTGTYTLALLGQGNGKSSGYDFRAYVSTQATTPVSLGPLVSGTISQPGERHVYTFSADAGQQIYITYATNTNLATTLITPSGQFLYGPGEITLMESGTYQFLIDGLDSATGAYNFNIMDIDALPTITPGTGFSGTLTDASPLAGYRIDGKAGERVDFHDTLTSFGFDAFWKLLGPSGQTLASNYVYNQGDLDVTLPADGPYTLVLIKANGVGTIGVPYEFQYSTFSPSTTPLPFDTIINANLATPGEQDVYSFTGSIGQQILFDSIASTLYGSMFLYSPSGLVVPGFSLGTFSSGDSNPVTLSENGTYRLVFIPDLNATGTYSFSLLNLSARSLIAEGTSYSGTLGAGEPTAVYKVSATAGQRLYFHNTITPTNYFDAAWALYNPAGEEVRDSYINGDLEYDVPETGTYLLKISKYNRENDLSYDFAYKVFTPTSTPLTLGSNVSKTLAQPGEQDTYTFTGSVGQRVYLDLIAGAFNGTVSLFSPTGLNIWYQITLADLVDQGPTLLNENGAYRLVIDGNDNATGNYQFRLSDLATSPAINAGTTYTGTLGAGAPAVLFRINGTVGQNLYIHNSSAAGANDATWTLYDAAGQPLATNKINGDLVATLTTTGFYSLVISKSTSLPDTDVPYSFVYSTFARSTSPLTLGSNVSGTLAQPGEQDSYTFTGSVGQRVYLDSIAAAPNLMRELVSPSGVIIWSTQFWATADLGPLTLKEAGTYTLRIFGTGTATGAYQFRLLDVAAAPPITPGSATIGGTLNPGTSTALYKITTTASGKTFRFDALGTVGSPSSWILYGPNDQGVALGSLNADLVASLPWAGTYVLAIKGANESAGGAVPYSFKVIDQSDAPGGTSGFGTVNSGTLDGGDGPTITFTYAISAGQVLDLNNLNPNSAAGIHYSLADATGAILSMGDDQNDSGPIVAPRTGTYTLTLTGSNGPNAFAFRLVALPDAATSLTLGATIDSSLTTDYQTDFYRFTGAIGQSLLIDGLGGAAGVQVYSPSGQIVSGLGTSMPNDSGLVPLVESGTYYVLVQGVAGSYSFRLLDIDASGTLGSGSGASGTISPPAATIAYRFDATAGQRIYADDTLALLNTGVFWQIYGPSGLSLARGYGNTDLEAVAPVTGTYTLVLGGADNGVSPDYDFNLYVSTDTTTAVSPGSLVQGSISQPGEQDIYTFNGSLGQQILFSLATNAIDGLGALIGPSGQVVWSSYLGSFGPINLVESGTYRLVIDGSGDSVGAYSFKFTDLSTLPFVQPNTSYSGTLGEDNQGVLYRFHGTAGQSYYFYGTSDSGNHALGMSLFSPSGAGIGGSSFNTGFEMTLPIDGVYTLAIGRSPFGPTSEVGYSFGYLPIAETTAPLTLGTPVNAGVTNPGDQHTYTFTGSVGQQVYFDNISGVLQGYATIIGPRGQVVWKSTNLSLGADGGPFTLTDAGTYRVVVDGIVNSTGSFVFDLINLSAKTPITQGAPYSGTLGGGAPAAAYRVSVTAGQRLFFHNTLGNGSTGANWSLYGTAGELLASGSIGDDLELTAATTGTYTLVASKNLGLAATPVAYDFTYNAFAPITTALTLKSTVSGSLSKPGEQDVYTFTGSVGMQLFYDRIDSNHELDLTLYSPSGVILLDDPSNSGDLSRFITLVEAGTYRLVVNGHGTSTGAYRFNLFDTAALPAVGTGATPLTFTVSLDAPATGAITINYATADGTAQAGVDYQATSGTLTFLPGETSKTVTVLAIQDSLNEQDETFTLNLSNAPAGTTIARGQGVATLRNDDLDLALNSVKVSGHTLTINYDVNGSAASLPFRFGLYRSSDASFGGDSLIGSIVLSSAADLAAGSHTKTFTLGSGPGQLSLPGAGAAEDDGEYYLLGVLDDQNSNDEFESDPYNHDNTQVVTGAYLGTGNTLLVHGGVGGDKVAVTPSGLSLTLAGSGASTYSLAGVATVRIWTHEGDDTINVAPGVAPAIFALGGAGNDTLTTGVANVTFDGGTGTNTARVDGTSGNDAFVVSSSGVAFGGHFAAITNAATVVDGLAGKDTFTVSGAVGNVTFDGGDDDDTVVFKPGSTLGGSLVGGAGVDTLDLSALTTASSVNLGTSKLTGLGGTFSGFQSIVVGSSTGSTAIGPDSSTNWVLFGSSGVIVTGMTLTGMRNFVGGTGNDTFILDNYKGGGAIDGGGGTNTLSYTRNVDIAISDTKFLVTGGPAVSLSRVTAANLTGGASANVFTLSGWTGTGNVVGGGGTDRIVLTKNANITLANAKVTAGDGLSMNLRNIAVGSLTVDATTASRSIDASAYAGVTLMYAQGSKPLTFKGGASNDMFILDGYTGTATISGGAGINSVWLTRDADMTLSNAQLKATGGPTASLSGVTQAFLTGGAANNTFTVGGWSGGGLILGGGGSANRIVATKDANLTLTNGSLKGGDGLNLALSGIQRATLTLINNTTARTINASAFAGVTSLTATGSAEARLIGGAGNDTLAAVGSGRAILVGGPGNDSISSTGTGRAILIGGAGADAMKGNGNTLMISGRTAYDSNLTALDQILAEWASTSSNYATRIGHILNGGGLNGSTRLTSSTVLNDAAIDVLGNPTATAADWFVVNNGDTVIKKAAETRTILS
ncbi:beta strand repeat-containing protein [Singulisphaera sp. PoT]|uniref:beta strand repeat-containing protein n=1 Tax=Singulisphaera sp. PoT TaxID=3411797 RepID=UPI003BF54382